MFLFVLTGSQSVNGHAMQFVPGHALCGMLCSIAPCRRSNSIVAEAGLVAPLEAADDAAADVFLMRGAIKSGKYIDRTHARPHTGSFSSVHIKCIGLFNKVISCRDSYSVKII